MNTNLGELSADNLSGELYSPEIANSSRIRLHDNSWPQQARYIETMLFQCWASIEDVGPTLKQHCFSVSCLLGCGKLGRLTNFSGALSIILQHCHCLRDKLHPLEAISQCRFSDGLTSQMVERLKSNTGWMCCVIWVLGCWVAHCCASQIYRVFSNDRIK